MKLKPLSDKELKIFLMFAGLPIMLNWLVAPWVWPIGALLVLTAAMIIQHARQENFLLPGLVGTGIGIVGCIFTLPPTSLHSFLPKANWSHVQNLPILSIYSVLLFVLGVTVFVYGCCVGKSSK